MPIKKVVKIKKNKERETPSLAEPIPSPSLSLSLRRCFISSRFPIRLLGPARSYPKSVLQSRWGRSFVGFTIANPISALFWVICRSNSFFFFFSFWGARVDPFLAYFSLFDRSFWEWGGSDLIWCLSRGVFPFNPEEKVAFLVIFWWSVVGWVCCISVVGTGLKRSFHR